MTEQAIIQHIQEICEKRHWTYYKLAKEAGMPYSSLNNLFARGTCPTIPTLEQICGGFGISMLEFFSGVSGFSSDKKKSPVPTENTLSLKTDEEDLIYMYRTLSKNDKALLTAYLKGLSKKL